MQSPHIPSALSRAFKRRSPRVQLKIRISLVSGDESILDAETTTVSKHGARIRVTSTHGKLTHGERLRVTLRRGQKQRAARVVWLDKRSAAHFGIEFDEDPGNPGNFWGVYFPSKDGELRGERKETPAPLALAPAPPALQPQNAGQLAVEGQYDLSSLGEIGRIPAMIAGLSAIRQPFAEEVEFVFTHPHEGVALLQNSVEPGATLRITFAHRIAQGYVVAVAGQCEAGRWRVRLRCESADA